MAGNSNKRAGVIGWPVAHSLSPRLHGYWLKRYGIDGTYEAIAATPEELKKTVRRLADEGYRGFNLTIPHKEAVMPLLDDIDDAARAIGAVNTVVIGNGKLTGSNTDAFGFMENIRAQAALPHKNKAVVLGAGGAARAVCKALLDEGFTHIELANRSLDKAHKLADDLGKAVYPQPWEKRNTMLDGASLLVNATSLGMKGKEPLDIALDALPADAVVNDIVYAPLETPLLAAAKKRGNRAVDGLGMLLYQAVPGFAAWFGVRPVVDEALRRHVMGGL